MQPEQPEEQIFRCHGYMEQKMSVLSVVQQRCLDLEQVRMILDQKFAPGLLGSVFKLFEELSHLSRVEIVDREPLMDRRLNGVSHSAEPVPELVLDPAETGVQQGGVGQDQGEQQTPDLMEAVLDTNKVLREILNNLKQATGGFLLLKKFSS